MIPKELFKQVKKIEIRTRRAVDDITAGAYRSVFKGRGIEFDEVREYTQDDDVRDIDWNVTARMGSPLHQEVHRGARTHCSSCNRCLGLKLLRQWTEVEARLRGRDRRASGLQRNQEQRQGRPSDFHRQDRTLPSAEIRKDAWSEADKGACR